MTVMLKGISPSHYDVIYDAAEGKERIGEAIKYDGVWYFWPSRIFDHWTPALLRAIADQLEPLT